jgi:hypothetical protein
MKTYLTRTNSLNFKYRGLRRGMLCADPDRLGCTFKVTGILNLFGRYYVTAECVRGQSLGLEVEGRDKDFVYKVSSPDLYNRIVTGQFSNV